MKALTDDEKRILRGIWDGPGVIIACHPNNFDAVEKGGLAAILLEHFGPSRFSIMKSEYCLPGKVVVMKRPEMPRLKGLDIDWGWAGRWHPDPFVRWGVLGGS